MTHEEKMNAYIASLKAFRDHLNACFDVLMHTGSGNENEIFYNTPFEITFHGKTIELANGADVFQGIEEIINGEIEEMEGEI